MQEKNKKLLIILGILVLVIGVSFAYYVARVTFNTDDGATVKGTTGKVSGATLDVNGTLSFDDLDILPGHKNVSSIKVTATGDNLLIPYNVIWNGTSTLNTPLNYTIYKSDEELDITATCNKKTKIENNEYRYYEECSISNIEDLESITTGTITNTDTNKTLLEKEFIIAKSDGANVYYYVIIEYPNIEDNQNTDIEGTFDGTIKVEETNIESLSIQVKGEDGEYKESTSIPNGYTVVNRTCTGTNNSECIVYLDKWLSASEKVLAKLNLTSKGKYNTNDVFTGIATSSDTGIYETEDDYGKSYYFRGLNDSLNNWVKFAGFYWRIVRINGNGSIRMIYSGVVNGNPSSANKTGTTTQIGTSPYNHTYNDNAYVGYMMGIPLNGTGTTKNTTSSNSSSYSVAHTNSYDSDIKKTIDTWYTTNINSKSSLSGKNYTTYLDSEVGFCNDRETSSGTYGFSGNGTGTSATSYASLGRVYGTSSWKTSQLATLKCTNKNRDLFTMSSANSGNRALTYPIGLITSDEVVYAGGFGGTNNSTYYLYTNQDYWTMSSSSFNSEGRARAFYVYSNGYLYGGYAYNAYGVRPVINLKANTKIQVNTDGSFTNPYAVEE